MPSSAGLEFDTVFNWDGVGTASSDYIGGNLALEMQSPLGTATTFFNTASHYLYLGDAEKFDMAVFDLATSGSLGALTWQFYNGSAWKTYMASSGDFYLAGAGSNGLTWDYSANTLTIDGAITVRTGYFGNGTSGFTVNSDYFANGKTTLTDGSAGVYIGTDGISLGADSVFMVDDDGALTATSATITGTITAADGDIGGWAIESGYIHKDGTRLNAGSNNGYLGIGVTAYDANDGIWLGEVSSGVYKFSIKNQDGSKYLRYNDSALEIAAGNFSLDASGNITATSVDLTGVIKATSGTIGSWTLANALYNGRTALTTGTGIYFGTDGIAMGATAGTPEFKVLASGALTATSATITGEIKATSGYIGGTSTGWDINSGNIASTGGTKKITLDATGGKIYIGTGTYNNDNTPFYADGSSQFSLGDALTFDGTDLELSGTVTATGG